MLNPIVKYFANVAFKMLYLALTKLSDEQLKDAAAKLNKKIDIPNISEDLEAEVIYGILSSSVKVTKELLSVIKL